ncbi:MAG: hypothetical protein NT144_00705, partial [Bacteroidia bacterium]|nr:hypothetical protein [Bacteroidia bacterium]
TSPVGFEPACIKVKDIARYPVVSQLLCYFTSFCFREIGDPAPRYRLSGYFHVQKFNLKAYVIINKYDLNTSMSTRIKTWCRDSKITVAGELPFDQNMVEAMVQGKSITEFNQDLNISKKIEIIWNKIINQKK